MKPEDNVGRIPKSAFIISTSVLLGLALVGVIIRILIRFRIQRQRPSIDDGFLAVALALLLISIGFMHKEVLNRMYLIVALQKQVEGVIPGPDWMQTSFQFHKWVTICLMMTWCTIMAVKFSFLFFFKRLINRIRIWWLYWNFVVLYNIGVLGYGVAIYYTSCPYFFNLRELECASGPYKKLLVSESVAQMVLDILGDFLIVVIPVGVTWQVHVPWKQKIILLCSLCLSIIMASLSIIRVSGLIYQGMVDTIWEVYWQSLAAEVAVFLAAAVSFRSFFVTRKNSRVTTPPYSIRRFVKESVAGTNRHRSLQSLRSSLYEGSRVDLEDIPATTVNAQPGQHPNPQAAGKRTITPLG